jgi:L-threonylcarbamoyladenylate synthase
MLNDARNRNTEVVEIDPARPDPKVLARAGQMLRRGGLVVFPTETVYGLGANALDRAAVACIFAAKGRPATNPVIIHVADVAQAVSVAATWPETAQKLAQRFWPGPVSFVLPKRSDLPDLVTAGGTTVALRCPAHAVALGLIEAAGVPIAAPSANRSTQLSPTRAEHALRGLNGRIDLLLDAGPTAGGLESSVIDLTVSPPRLLRPGLVTPQEIESLIGPIVVGGASADAQAGPVRSPGMLERHYAPRTPLECQAGTWPRVKELCQAGLRVGWLSLTPPREELPGLFSIEMAGAAQTYGANLYAALHTLDAMQLDRIVVELPPGGDAWLAVHDRLRRAATPGEEIG